MPRFAYRAFASFVLALAAGCDRPLPPDPVPAGQVELRPVAIAVNTNVVANNDLIGPSGLDIVVCDCDDGNPCNGVEKCTSGGACTRGTNAVKGTSCSDGNACNGAEVCDGAGSCIAGTTPSCDDNNPCTSDSCAAASGCTHAAVKEGTSCSDGDLCNGAELCDANGKCVAGTAPSCSDNNPCTDDACVAATGCTHTNNTAVCDDGNACTYGERCAAGTCGGGTTVVCQDDVCNTRTCNGTAVCSATPKTGTACNDTNDCSYGDACDANGRCSGTPITCTSDAQTIRSCNGTAKCAEMPRPGAPCDDGNPCTKDDAQLADGRCVGTAYTCAVTECLSANACDGKGGCRPVAKADGTGCDADHSKCTPHDVCKAGACVPDPTPVACVPRDCNTAACDPATGNCTYAPTSGGECGVTGCFSKGMCTKGVCSGVPKDCSAFDSSCTSGVCNADTGKCVSMSKPNGTSCETAAKCATGAACFFGRCELAPMVCPAATGPCKMPTCDEASGQCGELNRPVGSACDPGNPCLIGAHCTADGSCVGAPAPNGEPCTVAEGVAGACVLGTCSRVDDAPGNGPGGASGGARDAGVDAPAGNGPTGRTPETGGSSGGCTIGGHADVSWLAALGLAAWGAALAVRRRAAARARSRR